MNAAVIDADYIAERVRELQRGGFPTTEGYYLVVVSPEEAEDLLRRLKAARAIIPRRHGHLPAKLAKSAHSQGFKVTCIVDDALVVSADHTEPTTPRRSSPPPPQPLQARHLRLVR